MKPTSARCHIGWTDIRFRDVAQLKLAVSSPHLRTVGNNVKKCLASHPKIRLGEPLRVSCPITHIDLTNQTSGSVVAKVLASINMSCLNRVGVEFVFEILFQKVLIRKQLHVGLKRKSKRSFGELPPRGAAAIFRMIIVGTTTTTQNISSGVIYAPNAQTTTGGTGNIEEIFCKITVICTEARTTFR